MITNIIGDNNITTYSNYSAPSWGYYTSDSATNSGVKVGTVRLIPNNMSNYEVWNGTAWVTAPTSTITIGFTAEINQLLDWVRVKKEKEDKMEILAKENPIIQTLLDDIEHKKLQLDVIVGLVK